MIKFGLFLTLLTLICLSTGCTTSYRAYAGDPRAATDLVVINGYLEDAWAVFRYRRLLVKSLDDFKFRDPPRIETLPGHHKLSVFYSDNIIVPGGETRCTRDVDFAVQLNAGRSYALSYGNKDGILNVWLYDKETQQRVGEATIRSCEVF